MANRSIHYARKVQPFLDAQYTVVSDRGILSGMVYAKIKTYSFDQWFDLLKLAGIKTFPDLIVFCDTEHRKIQKEKDNRYDNAGKKLLKQIDDLFEEGIQYIQQDKILNKIPILKFDNDFNLTIEENVDNLIDLIKNSGT